MSGTRGGAPQDAALRYGAAALGMAADTGLNMVSKMLGHSSIVITADTYTSALLAGSRPTGAGLSAPRLHACTIENDGSDATVEASLQVSRVRRQGLQLRTGGLRADFLDYLAQVQAAHGSLVLVGDHHQLPELDAGGAFAGLARRLDPIRLQDNHRQVEPWERTALDELRAGDVATALAAYDTHGRLLVSPTADDQKTALVAAWWARQHPEPPPPASRQGFRQGSRQACRPDGRPRASRCRGPGRTARRLRW